MKSFKERIRFARNRKGLTQTELGDSCGVTKGAISHWETGTVDELIAETACLAAEKLEVSTDWLVMGSEPMGRNGALSPEENELLSFYRDLSPDRKKRVIANLTLASLINLDVDPDALDAFQKRVAAPEKKQEKGQKRPKK